MAARAAGNSEVVNRMKIAHITATFPPYHGGTGNVCFHNARELVRLGHEVHVFTAQVDDAPHYSCRDGVIVNRLRPKIRYGNAFLLPSLVDCLPHFDLLHLHMPFYGGAEFVHWVHKMHRIPLVVTHHQDVKLDGITGVISKSHDWLIGRSLMKSANRACFTSLDYAQSSQFASMITRNQLQVGVLPNGIDPERFTPGKRPLTLAQKLNLQNKKVILFVGALDQAHYFKGVPVLLQSFAALAHEDAALVVVGSGDMRTAYEQMAQELGIADRTVFAGYVPDDQLVDYYRLADVTVLPSTTSGEAFGVVLLESLACETPVIASSLPGVRTVVSQGDDGYLVAPDNVPHLTASLNMFFKLSPESRQALGEAGRKKIVQQFSWASIGKQLEGMYRDILKSRYVVSEQTNMGFTTANE